MSITVKRILSLALLIMAGLCTANAQDKPKNPGDCPGKNGLMASEISVLLAAHNKIRTELHLPLLTWNCKLADYAQEWATRGVFEHRESTDFGENIFVATSPRIAAVMAIRKWFSEKPFWDNREATCHKGKVCGHYTQLVWRTTTEFGCGVNRNTRGEFKTLLVCNYNPAGNSDGPAY